MNRLLCLLLLQYHLLQQHYFIGNKYVKERNSLQGQNISQSNHNRNNAHHCYADIVAGRPTFSRSSSSHKQFAHTRGAAAIVFVFRSLIGTSPPSSAWFCSRTDPSLSAVKIYTLARHQRLYYVCTASSCSVGNIWTVTARRVGLCNSVGFGDQNDSRKFKAEEYVKGEFLCSVVYTEYYG